jgi:hypothetical protein
VDDEELPFYVGKGKANRARNHLKPELLAKPSYKNHIIRKAIREGKRIHIEYEATELTEKQAFGCEINTIAFYGRRNNGTGCLANMTDGGEGRSGDMHDAEARRKMAEAWQHRERGYKHTEQSKRNMAAGRKAPSMGGRLNLGRVHTEQSRMNMSEGQRRGMTGKGNRGRVHSEQARLNMSLAAKRRYASKSIEL